MKKIFTILLLLTVVLVYSQEKKENQVKVGVSGFVKFNSFLDTYKSVSVRDGDIYLYPLAENLDDDGNDLNANPAFNMITAQTRLRVKASGAEAFGAKVNSTIEVDFYGLNDALVRMPRIRHAFFNLNWGNTQLLFGQTWHPLFTVECYPEVIGMGASLPFNPLNRAPQVRLTNKFTENVIGLISVNSHGDMESKGNVEAQKYAVIPDIHGQIKYISESVTIGATAGYKILRPRLSFVDSTDATYGTDKTIGAFDVAGFIKIKTGGLTVKGYGIYGQNLSSYTMLGGYGAATNTNIGILDGNNYDNDYDYVNINTMAVWGEILYKSGPIGYGVFAGYSKNLGVSGDDYFDVGATRSANIDNILRITPRVTYTSGKVMLGFEYMYATATYISGFETNKYVVKSTADPVANHRFLFTAMYSF